MTIMKTTRASSFVVLIVLISCATPTLTHAHRQYDPSHNRFQQRDPIEYSDGPNFYSSARMNPICLVDPDGLRVRVRDDGSTVNIELNIGMWGNRASFMQATNAENWIKAIWPTDKNGNPHRVRRKGGCCKSVTWTVSISVGPAQIADCENLSAGDSSSCHAFHNIISAAYDNSWKVFHRVGYPTTQGPGLWSNGPLRSPTNRGGMYNWYVEPNCTPGPGCGLWNGNGWAHEAGHLMGDVQHHGPAGDIMSTYPNQRQWSSTTDVVTILNVNSSGGYRGCPNR